MVQRKGVTIDLTPIEFQILYILASHPGQAYSKERLYELIWKEPYFGNENVLNTHINRLLLKLKSNAEDSFICGSFICYGFYIDLATDTA